MVGASDGISDRNPCELDLFCTDKITRTIKVTSKRVQAVTRRLAPGQTHGRVVNADFAVPPAPGMGLPGQPEPQVLYLQPDSATARPYQIWYNRVENKLGGTNPLEWCLITMKRSPTGSARLIRFPGQEIQ